MTEPFALLLTVYAGDRWDHLRAAFHSVAVAQSRPPDQIVLVQDGPVSAELEQGLRELRAGSPVEVTFLRLEHNGGLGPALDAGLAASKYDVVARMDADDISMPNRFEVQLALIEQGVDLVGAGLQEFGKDLSDLRGVRTPPVDPARIARYARLHDPFNHPTVVYRRSAVIAAGGYRDLPLMEDYWLFARMIANGARMVNVAEPLVYYRVGDGAYERRGGVPLLRSELRLQRELLRYGFTSRVQYIRNVVIRGGYRLVPTWLRRSVYRRVVATHGARLNAAAPGPPDAPQPELQAANPWIDAAGHRLAVADSGFAAARSDPDVAGSGLDAAGHRPAGADLGFAAARSDPDVAGSGLDAADTGLDRAGKGFDGTSTGLDGAAGAVAEPGLAGTSGLVAGAGSAGESGSLATSLTTDSGEGKV